MLSFSLKIQQIVSYFDRSRYFCSLLSILLITLLCFPKLANAHAYSASYTKITMDEKKTELVFTLDTLSLIELLPDIDLNKNWVLEKSEVKKSKDHIEELITEGLTLDKNNKEVTPKVETMKLVKKKTKSFFPRR